MSDKESLNIEVNTKPVSSRAALNKFSFNPRNKHFGYAIAVSLLLLIQLMLGALVAATRNLHSAEDQA